MTELTERVRTWRGAGEYVDVGGHQLFLRRQSGDGPLLVLLHGYPSSSYDWRGVLPALSGRRVLAFDFLGFGLSAKPRLPRYSLMTQADLVETLVAGEDALVVAHDMGTSVANELMARDLDGRLSFGLRAVLLFNGSMVVEKARLTPAQRVLRTRFGPLLARLSNPVMFRTEFRRIFSSAHPLERAEADDQWALLAHAGGNRILDRLTNYLHERVEHAPRWHGALRDWPRRLELGWAGHDPVCVEDVLQAVLALRPTTPLTRWPALGHYPQIEEPGTVAAAIIAFADRPAT
jgi:pimeloyl-ACP methyl ester carboxylesterase